MTRPSYKHQLTLTKMIVNYWLLTRFQQYEVLPEPPANPDDGCSRVPDLGFYKRNTKKPVVILEISDSEGASKGFRGKLYSYADLYDVRQYRFKELFHFDFYADLYTRYDFTDPQNRGVELRTTYSDVLKLDLMQLLAALPY